MQPGQTINPGRPTPGSPQPETPQQPPATPPAEPSQTSQDFASEPQDNLSVQNDSAWQFSEQEDDNTDAFAISSTPAVNWTASEYIAHDKNPGWYLLTILAALVVAALVFLVTRDKVSSVVVAILGIAFVVFGARKPQVLEYSIDSTGVRIGQKQYPFGLFRTFSVVEEDAIRSILLMPLQRFNLPISIYYDPADEQTIVEALSAHLPHEERRMSPVDNLMRKIRF